MTRRTRSPCRLFRLKRQSSHRKSPATLFLLICCQEYEPSQFAPWDHERLPQQLVRLRDEHTRDRDMTHVQLHAAWNGHSDPGGMRSSTSSFVCGTRQRHMRPPRSSGNTGDYSAKTSGSVTGMVSVRLPSLLPRSRSGHEPHCSYDTLHELVHFLDVPVKNKRGRSLFLFGTENRTDH